MNQTTRPRAFRAWTIALTAAVGAALIGAVWVAVPTHADADAAECQNPGEVLDLKSWKLTLPVADPEDEDQPLEIFQPELDAYSHDPWFVAQDDCEAVRFSNPVNGVTTPNSDYSRSELREMTEDGQDEASWSSTEGTHTLVVQQAITSLPKEKDHVVAGQIHDEDDDVSVFRLEGSSLYVTDDDDSNAHLITDNYELGTKFEAKFVVTGGEIQAYYDGELVATLSKDFSGGYFKAGAYTQANCENSSPCSEDNFGEVVVYDVAVTHE